MPLRVLLITPRFYGIEKNIISILEGSGYEVEWIENISFPFDYHGSHSKFRFIRKIYFFLFSPHKRHLRKELKKIGNRRFDLLFAINAFIICPFLFRHLRRINKEIRSVLYLWDSFSKYEFKEELRLFDKVFTFDPVDSERLGIGYKPNFYLKVNNYDSIDQENDLIFIGKFTPDRSLIIDKIFSTTGISTIRFLARLWPAYTIFPHNHLIYRFLKRMNVKGKWIRNYLQNFEAVEGILKKNYIIRSEQSYFDTKNQILASNTILDLPFPDQSGCTHRVIEALAYGKKLLTTNHQIENEIFYNPRQIKFFDPEKTCIDFDWIRQRSVFPVPGFVAGLELSVWLNSLISEGISSN